MLTVGQGSGIITGSSRRKPLLTPRLTLRRLHMSLRRIALLCGEWYVLYHSFFSSCRAGLDESWRCIPINDLMINEEIRDREVRVVDQNGEQLGVMSSRQALELAEERQLDLVKIAPQARPPVCKLMDYGKYRFEQSKREREIRKNQKVVTVKEVRLSATIEDHDIEVREKQAIKFLKDGDKVKATIRFRGRQIAHSEIGMEVMKDFAERIKDYGTITKKPSIEGRNMFMIIDPKDEK